MKRIFKYFVEGEHAPIFANWFVNSFPLSDFQELDKMIYLFLDYTSKFGIPANKSYLQSFLKTDAKRLMREHNIKTPEMGASDFSDPAQLEEAFRIMTIGLQNYHDVLMTKDDNETEGNFKIAINDFMESKKKELAMRVITTSYASMSSEDLDIVFTQLAYDIERIMEDYDRDKLMDLDFILNLHKEEDSSGSMIKICDTTLPCIDGDIGGIFKQLIITFTGLSGVGKTRWAMRFFVYVAAVLFGKDVRVDSLELSRKQIENMLIAMHIVTLWKGQIKIPDSEMNKNNLDDEAMKYYKAAKRDLFSNTAYGTIFINDKSLIVEKFYKESRQYLAFHKDTAIWVIDYAGLAMSQPTSKYGMRLSTKADIIDKLYTDARRISNLTGCTFLILNQYNQEGAQKARAGKTIDQGDIQGGQTVHKFTDYNIYSTQTLEQKAAGLMDITADKVRGAKGFSHVLLGLDLSISKFEQMKGKGAQV